jgi:hypothetical protein
VLERLLREDNPRNSCHSILSASVQVAINAGGSFRWNLANILQEIRSFSYQQLHELHVS